MSKLMKDLESIKKQRSKAMPIEIMAKIKMNLELNRGGISKSKFICRWMTTIHPSSKRLKCGFAAIHHDSSKKAGL